jgi:hypothetical protein
MTMRSEVVGRHETVEGRQVLGRQLSIWGVRDGQHVAYEVRSNAIAKSNVLLEDSLIARREPMQRTMSIRMRTMQPESLLKRLQPASLQGEQVGDDGEADGGEEGMR